MQLDVTDLGFADVATIRRLALFDHEAEEPGHDITTCGADHTIRKVAGLMDVEDDLGLS